LVAHIWDGAIAAFSTSKIEIFLFSVSGHVALVQDDV